MQSRSFGVLARGGLRVSSRTQADACSLVCGVAMTALVAGCANSGGGSAPSDSIGTASTSGGTRSGGDEASNSSKAEREPTDGGASNAGGSRSVNASKAQSGGTRATSSELAGIGGSGVGGSESLRSSAQSTRSTSSSGGARATHTAIGNAGGQVAATSDSIVGGRAATGGTTSTSPTVGGSPAGGSSASGGSSAAVTGTDPFVQIWQDDFDSFDASKWELMTHSWEGNLAQFSTENVSVASGILSIHLTAAAGDTAKPYRGVEMRSKRTLTYGKVSARVRFARGPGVVSGLVTIYTPWPADNWNEIDIEHLGKSPTSTQLNCMVYTGAPVTAPVTQSVSPTQDPLSVNLGFDAEADFHQYDVEWTEASVIFSIDGKVLRTWTKEIARMTLPQNILFTIWASSSADWAGAMTSSSVPTSAQIDWIRVYEWRK